MSNNGNNNGAWTPETASKTSVNALSRLCEQLQLSNTMEVANILMGTVMPERTSDADLAAFCMVAAAYNLNPLMREIFAFSQNGHIVPLVSIDGWLKIMHSHPDFDGITYEYGKEGDDEWCEASIFSKRCSRPMVVREYLSENRVASSPVWKQRPRRMLRHRATIQAIRYFAGISGVADKEEMEEAQLRDVTPRVRESFVEQAARKNEQQQGQQVLPPALTQEPEGDEIPGLESQPMPQRDDAVVYDEPQPVRRGESQQQVGRRGRAMLFGDDEQAEETPNFGTRYEH